MNTEQLFENIKRKGSYLCVGLDTDIRKIPRYLLDATDPVFAFNKEIVDATADVAVAYKPNLAFYEMLGVQGWSSWKKLSTTFGITILTFLSLLMPNGAILATLPRCMPGHFSTTSILMLLRLHLTWVKTRSSRF